jgi:hypothetical protein
MKRKILYSPGFGAGWTTWNSGEVAKYMLTYQPIIDWLEAGGKAEELDNEHQLIVQLKAECLEKFKEDYVCTLGSEDLVVKEVSGRVRMHEYDGSERVEEEGEFTDWV